MNMFGVPKYTVNKGTVVVAMFVEDMSRHHVVTSQCQVATSRRRFVASHAASRLLLLASRDLASSRSGFNPKGRIRGMDLAVGVAFRNVTGSVSFPIQPKLNANFLLGIV
jgi:hypothetical protein